MTATVNAHGAAAWYAIWTRTRHEKVVLSQLMRKNIEAFLPTAPRWSQWKDRRKKIEWPLFPGYCFARFDPSTSTLPVLTCEGVLNIVTFDAKPVAIADTEMNSLRLVVARDLPCDPCPCIAEGSMVEVIGGPLRGVVGRLLKKDARSATVVLSVNLLQQAVRVEVDVSQIESRCA